uniref:Uncharacterized protein n=1 Tax=Lepeophtheirus salmonis TaxID=72036 RepID=A0A0K2UXU6_LEPSM
MKESERSSSRRLVSSRTASFESLTDEGVFEEGLAGAPKKRDSSWDSKWKSQLASNGTPPFIRRIGGSPGRLDNRKWEEKGACGSTSASANASPHLGRRRIFKSPSVERKFLRTPPPLPPGPPIPEALREASSSSSSSSEATPPLPPYSSSSTRSESIPQSPRTVRRKLVIRAAKTPSPLPKEWGSALSSNDSRIEEGETSRTITSKETKSRTQTRFSEETRLQNESREFEGRQKIVRESPPHSPRHTGTYTAMPAMAVSDEESSSLSRTPSMNRYSPEKKKFLDSMLNNTSEKMENDSTTKYKSLGEMRNDQGCESRHKSSHSGSWSQKTESKTFSSTKSYEEQSQSSKITLQEQSASSSQMSSQFIKSENTTQSNKNISQMETTNQERIQQQTKQRVPMPHSMNEQRSFEERLRENLRQMSSSKDQNNNDIPDTIVHPKNRQSSPKESPSPSENVLTSLEKLVKETESMINKHLDTEEDKIVRPSEVLPPPLPPPRSASINKVPLPVKTDAAHHFVPPPPPPPPPVKFNKLKPPSATPSRLVREASPSSTISEEILNTAKELQQQRFDINTDELDKAEKILDKKKQAQEERTLKKRLVEQKIKKEEMFRLKKEKEQNCPPPEEDPDPLDSIIFQGIPPRPVRHTPTPQLYNDPYGSTRDYGRPTMVRTPVPFNLQHNRSPTKELCRESKTDGTSLRDEIQNQRSNSSQRMRALKDVEKRDKERIMELRRSMIEDESDSVTHEESFPPPPNFLEEKKHSADPRRFVVLRDPSLTAVDDAVVDNKITTHDEEEYLDTEERELEALRSAGQKERELLEEMERRKREIEEEIARERKRIEELHKIENERRIKFHNMKKTQRSYQPPPKAVQQYEEMVARKMNVDRRSSTPTPPPPPLPSHVDEPRHTGAYESSEFDEETDTEGYGDEEFSLGIDIPYADFSSNNVTPTPTSGELEDLEQESVPPPRPIPPSPVNLRSLLRSRSSLPYCSHDEDGSRKVHFSEIDQVKVLSMESLLSTINSETSEPIYSNLPSPPSSQIETAFHQSRNYYQVRPPYRNQTV